MAQTSRLYDSIHCCAGALCGGGSPATAIETTAELDFIRQERFYSRVAFYNLRPRKLWGDYDSILMRGLGAERDAITGHLLLHRAGPFAPPIIFTREVLVSKVVLVTQTFKEKLEAANFGDLQFIPTIKKHIVNIPWETWDREARFPWGPTARVKGIRPVDGEPENYLIGQVHSTGAAAEMEDIWELIAPEASFEIEKSELLGGGKRRYFITPPRGEHRGLFRPRGHLLFVDENGRQWFEREADGWVEFNEVAVT